MDRLKTAEKKADEVKARYLVGLKNNLDRYLPLMGYTQKDMANLLEMHETAFSRFMCEVRRGLTRDRLLRIESWLDKARATAKRLELE